MSDEERIASKFRRLIELRDKRDQTKEAAETANEEYRTYEAELYDELADSPIEGTRKINLGPPYGTVRFTPRTTNFGRITDVDKALQALNALGRFDAMTKPQVKKERLNEFVREHLELGKPLPDGIDWYANRGITITRPKTKDGSLDV